MTKKEKATNEMAELMRAENERMYEYQDGYICSPHDLAVVLYDADYRKADEIRKQTAKEILAYFDRYAMDGNHLTEDLIFDMKKRYSVEVDE